MILMIYDSHGMYLILMVCTYALCLQKNLEGVRVANEVLGLMRFKLSRG